MCTFREEAMMQDASPFAPSFMDTSKTEKLIHKSLGINEVEV
jgi:hypothetical protein